MNRRRKAIELINRQMDDYRDLADMFAGRLSDIISDQQKLSNMKNIILKCGEAIVRQCVDTEIAKDIYSDNTMLFPDDRSAMRDYINYKGANIELDELNECIKNRLRESAMPFMTEKQLEAFLVRAIYNYPFDVEFLIDNWGEESLKLTERIREGILRMINPEYKGLLKLND